MGISTTLSTPVVDISLWFVYVYRRRLGEYVPNLLTKFNPVRGFIRYFHASIDVNFARVPNLLTKFTPVRGTYLPNPPSIFADGDGDAADWGLLGATARFSMPVVDPMI